MSVVERLLPRPWLVLVLAGFWVLLNNHLSLGVVAAGLVVGWLVALFTDRFWSRPTAYPRRPLLVARLLGRLLTDIVVANLSVAALILRFGRRPRSAFVAYPLRVRGEVPVTVLSSLLSLTPGTVTVDVDRAGGRLWIHCLDLEDEAALIERIRQRYETLIEEIFP
ncbi:Na+/H+ antiporter subunit E [Thiohalorhabdus denitrificans]|uniref:Multicomponent K+:H+ antiporter subunit E n=1 Tax=Thiohalorhabdus denitrificans TaxID=381306 RepID=A0A1G5GFT2_9GAMM|nr:Na+/H+ antiporter subunit E [Thiohalorhabdus denitrificans]SCY50159.1 multicomponent K+:H+ antiporter subunit E [Thiohalorhabdus denitrificans]